MTKIMLIDATHPEETRVAVVDGRRLEEFDVEVASRHPLKGNIYLAKVTRVEPSLQAAFVEYGGNRHGFLAFSEIHPDYYRIPVADREALMREDIEEAEADDHKPRRGRDRDKDRDRDRDRNRGRGGQRHRNDQGNSPEAQGQEPGQEPGQDADQGPDQVLVAGDQVLDHGDHDHGDDQGHHDSHEHDSEARPELAPQSSNGESSNGESSSAETSDAEPGNVMPLATSYDSLRSEPVAAPESTSGDAPQHEATILDFPTDHRVDTHQADTFPDAPTAFGEADAGAQDFSIDAEVPAAPHGDIVEVTQPPEVIERP